MRKLLMAAFMSVLALGLSVGEAEAARLGGGKSFGMQRSVVSKPAPTRQTAQPAPAPAGTTAAAPKRNWMGPIAGLAAGLGIAALLSHFGLGEGMANILTIALLVMAAVFVFRLLTRRSAPATADNSLRYAGAGETNVQVPPQVVSQSGSSSVDEQPAVTVPDGFDVEGFLRVAKLNFIRLQAANDAKNIEDIREFVSPEFFAEIKMQMDERGDAAQQTDVVTLNAELLEVVTEGDRHIATVRFNGMIREVAGAAAESFDEAWVLTKSKDGSKGWTVAGIQQLG